MIKQSAGILLFDSKGRVLLQHRKDDAPHGNKWCFFGGMIEKGETPLEAVKRECMEELCYPLVNPRLIHEETVDEIRSNVHVFVEEYDPEKRLELREGKNMKWFLPKETKELDFVPGLGKMLLKVKEKIR